jgi:hypothetical protein
MHDEYEMESTDTGNRIGVGFVLMLVAAFALTTMFALLAPIGAGAEVSGKRDEDVREVAFVSDDDDDNDNDSAGKSHSGDPSIGSNSGNTKTGTTQGTGVSRSVSNSSDKSKDTRTGTTQGTGPSKSVSNSS